MAPERLAMRMLFALLTGASTGLAVAEPVTWPVAAVWWVAWAVMIRWGEA